MKKIFASITIISFIFTGCDKDPVVQSLPPGTYKGTFRRSLSTETSNVTLTLSADGKFSGTSEKTHYPDICNGNYAIAKDSLLFENGCVYTADFDWTVILNGKYRYELSLGDSLVIYRSYGGFVNPFDIYSLKKQ